MEGTLEVLAVDEKGQQDKFDLVIHKLEAVEGAGAATELISGDVEIEGTYGDNKIDVSLKKGPMSQAAANCIQELSAAAVEGGEVHE